MTAVSFLLQGCDLIFVVCVGWEFYNVETIALDYPDVYWIWVDNATGADRALARQRSWATRSVMSVT